MKLLTKELTAKLNRAGYAGTKPVCKLFTPWGRATWLATGIEDGILYGYADLGEFEKYANRTTADYQYLFNNGK